MASAGTAWPPRLIRKPSTTAPSMRKVSTPPARAIALPLSPREKQWAAAAGSAAARSNSLHGGARRRATSRGLGRSVHRHEQHDAGRQRQEWVEEDEDDQRDRGTRDDQQDAERLEGSAWE